MKNWCKSLLATIVLTMLAAVVFYYFLLPAFNVKDLQFWIFVVALLLFAAITNEIFFFIFAGKKRYARKGKGHTISVAAFFAAIFVGALGILFATASTPMFHAKGYSNILEVQEDCSFEKDLSETLSTDAIAIMDTNSARMLGDRKLGSLSSLVSQYDVGNEYSQINYKGAPAKVSALDYAGFFKYIKNRNKGVPGYVLVSPVNMSAEYVSLEENMKYVPSAYFSKDLFRHIRSKYRTEMIRSIWFEIDEQGKPYYVATVYDNTIGLFGGQDVVGAILIDPVTGEMEYKKSQEIPDWVDIIYDGHLLCEQYDYYGNLKNGYWNSKFSAEGCKVTTDDFGYVAMNEDIWVYTGVTSVNSDASNIGFVLMNERTKETKFYEIAGADESSAMRAAEGEVQQYGYKASFPSLINIDGDATYIMVLKDSGGLVKMYAAVNAEQYNIVATASGQKECIDKYRRLLKTDGDEEASQEQGTTAQNPEKTETPLEDSLFKERKVVVRKLEQIVVDGNTVLYLLTEDGKLYHAKYTDVLGMMDVKEGQKITIRVYEEYFRYGSDD